VQTFDFTHDASGNLTAISSPQSGGYSEAIAYTPVDLVEAFQLPAGASALSYDADRRPTGGASPYGGGQLSCDGDLHAPGRPRAAGRCYRSAARGEI
jgi:hypothetical protein